MPAEPIRQIALLSSLLNLLVKLYLDDPQLSQIFPLRCINMEMDDDNKEGSLIIYSNNGIISVKTAPDACNTNIYPIGESARQAAEIFKIAAAKYFPVVL